MLDPVAPGPAQESFSPIQVQVLDGEGQGRAQPDPGPEHQVKERVVPNGRIAPELRQRREKPLLVGGRKGTRRRVATPRHAHQTTGTFHSVDRRKTLHLQNYSLTPLRMFIYLERFQEST